MKRVLSNIVGRTARIFAISRIGQGRAAHQSAIFRGGRRAAIAITFLGTGAIQALAAGQTGALRLELNKLEASETGCRTYFVIANKDDRAYDAFQLDLIFFGSDGVIAKRIAVDAAPLRAAKTSVKLFDVGGLNCASIGSILINDVIACRSGAENHTDCIGAIAPESRLSVPLMK